MVIQHPGTGKGLVGATALRNGRVCSGRNEEHQPDALNFCRGPVGAHRFCGAVASSPQRD